MFVIIITDIITIIIILAFSGSLASDITNFIIPYETMLRCAFLFGDLSFPVVLLGAPSPLMVSSCLPPLCCLWQELGSL